MNKRFWIAIWTICVIAAVILLYPPAYRAFAKPSLTVCVIDPYKWEPVVLGKVYLTTDKTSIDAVLSLNKHGKVAFKKLSPMLATVTYVRENSSPVKIENIKIEQHSGNRTVYIYYSVQHQIAQANSAVQDTTISADVSATLTPEEMRRVQNMQPCNVLYDEMSIRETASLEGKVLATLKKDDTVFFSGEESTNQSMVTLGGQQHVSTWKKVYLPNGINGWIVSSAIEAQYDNEGGD